MPADFDADGLAAWLGQLQLGAPRPLAAQGILTTPEGTQVQVAGAYRDVLGRKPDQGAVGEGLVQVRADVVRRDDVVCALQDQHRDGDLAEQVPDIGQKRHPGKVTGNPGADPPEAALLAQLPPQLLHFAQRLLALDRLRQQNAQARRIDGLAEIVVGAFLDRLDRGLDSALCGEQDDRQIGQLVL